MRSFVFNILSALHKQQWKSSKRPRIIIHTDSYFTKDSWERSLKDRFHGYNNSEIIYVKNRFALSNVIDDADFAFLWSISAHTRLEKSSLKMIYFGTRGLEFLNGRSIPDKIIVENPGQIASEAIAEYALSVALMLNRKLHLAINNQAKRKWDQSSLVNESYIPLKSKTVGILGLGHNGSAIARYFKNFGCKIIALDKRNIVNKDVDQLFLPEQLNPFLSLTDILILAAPLQADTENIINSKTLAHLKKGSTIINIARGGIINEKDLLKAIDRGKVKYTALDVFKKEPLGFFDKRWKNPSIVITPHIAGNINLFIEEIQHDFCNKLNKMISDNV